MPPGKIGNTGSAKVERVGQTSGNQYGQNPRAKNDKRQPPRDEKP